MNSLRKRRGPFAYRITIAVLSSILFVLLVWLLGFVLGDIGRIEGPDREKIEAKYVSQEDLDSMEDLRKEKSQTRRLIQGERQLQTILENDTKTSRATMEQLIELRRLSLEKGVAPTDEEITAMSTAQTRFLAKQEELQAVNVRLANLSKRQAEVTEQIDRLDEKLRKSREPAREEFEDAYRTHQLWLATYKLALLIPLFLLTAGLFMRKRESRYRPLFLSAFLACAWSVGRVIHEHFPSEVFKYVAIGTSIFIVLLFLVKVIRMLAVPKLDWLIEQYRGAYQRQRCPICTKPIRRGPLRYVSWTRKGPDLRGSNLEPTDENKPYTCPACGTQLFAECQKCGETRHCLLPHCESCGDETALEDR